MSCQLQPTEWPPTLANSASWNWTQARTLCKGKCIEESLHPENVLSYVRTRRKHIHVYPWLLKFCHSHQDVQAGTAESRINLLQNSLLEESVSPSKPLKMFFTHRHLLGHKIIHNVLWIWLKTDKAWISGTKHIVDTGKYYLTYYLIFL